MVVAGAEISNPQAWAAEILGTKAELAVIDAVASLQSEKVIAEMEDQSHRDAEISRKHGRTFNLEVDITGDVFERVALSVLEKEHGEPEDPETSRFLVETMRHPRAFLNGVRNDLTRVLSEAEARGITPVEKGQIEAILSNLARDAEKVPEMARNSDAIAFRTQGELVQITGAFEMKGYKDLTATERLDSIGTQLEDSEDEIYNTFKTIAKYYPIFKSVSGSRPGVNKLPASISLIPRDDFEQILVVPRNAKGATNEEEIEETLKVLRTYGCTGIKTINITTGQVHAIKEAIMPKIREKMSRRR